ncbi:hypothetical protein [Pyxidicoccus trucidator]|uniref:hypothetical protein n=1 Tax=Pyxidicoccus trucidator TaxID=2709662 RepID=UPI00196812CA|nr:hypothetical protein [Pyxidicoccus trucidator]
MASKVKDLRGSPFQERAAEPMNVRPPQPHRQDRGRLEPCVSRELRLPERGL